LTINRITPKTQLQFYKKKLCSVAKGTSKYKLDLVGVDEVRWDRGGTEPAGEYTFFYGKGTDFHELGTGFRYRFLYIRESYQQLSGYSLLMTGCRT
jgi:hypothetical protein